MAPSPADAAFLKARLAAAQVRRSREGAVLSRVGRLVSVGSGATQAAPMQRSGSAAAMGGSISPFGLASWLASSRAAVWAAWHSGTDTAAICPSSPISHAGV